ncbi:MAG: uroporphyrinogen decarboxylase family protein [Spirochaetota bacterium]
MNSREKFLSVLRMENGRYGEGVEIPKVEFGYWAGTIRAWLKEGLAKTAPVPDDIADGIAVMSNKNIYGQPETGADVNVHSIFNLDWHLTKFPCDYSPMFKPEVLETNGDYLIYRDSFGVINKNDKGMRSLPMELDHPVKDWDSWNQYKQYYTEDTVEQRLPAGWENLVKSLKARDFPLRLGGTSAGFLGFPRQIMGVTAYLMALYDQPDLIHDICDTFLNFLLSYYARIIREVEVDCILIWEDMAGKQGSLISPDHFREFLAPRYRAMVKFARDEGVDIVLTDSDGYVAELIPLLVETGVTGMYPFERAAGNDLLKIREGFPDFQIIGGFDKRVLFKDSSQKAIETELAMARTMLRTGRYIPHVDHFVSPDCTWENFSYYRRRLNTIIDEINTGRSEA